MLCDVTFIGLSSYVEPTVTRLLNKSKLFLENFQLLVTTYFSDKLCTHNPERCKSRLCFNFRSSCKGRVQFVADRLYAESLDKFGDVEADGLAFQAPMREAWFRKS